MCTGEPKPRRRGLFLIALAIACLGFVALGAWQVQRMQWKRALIERVEARVAAAPVPLPPRARWPAVSAASDEYRRVRIVGAYLPGVEVRTQAVTGIGGGSWVLSALRTTAGEVVFINRGFVPDRAQPEPAPSGPVAVTGLLRITEPGGGFLRRNDPDADRWYSRDIAAIARARGVPGAAPFFVDAWNTAGAGGAGAQDVGASARRWPRPGLTVVRFRDSHLSYALTWFGLAVLTAWAGLRLWRMDRRAPPATDPQETDP